MTIRLPIGIFVLAGGLLTGAGIACAQDANRDVVVTQSDMGSVVDRIQRGTGRFKEQFDHAVEHSMMDEKGIDKDAKHRADDLHNSANKLGDVFHDKRDKNNPAVRDQADRTLSAASEVNRVMMNHRFTDKLQSDWDNLRSDFNALAQVYGLSPLDAGAPAQ
jgi:hypothetical protein